MSDGPTNSNPNDEVIVVLPGGTKLPLTRRSIETGEFWLVVAIVAALIWLQALGKIPATLGTVAEVVIGLGMTWLRNHAKKVGGEQVVDVIEAAKTLPAPFRLAAPGTLLPIEQHPDFEKLVERFGRSEAVSGTASEIVKGNVPGGTPATAGGTPALPKDGGTLRGTAGATLVVLAALMLCSCGTVVKERGQTVLYVPANAKRVEFRTRSTSLTIDELDHAVVHKAVGGAVANGAAGVGASVATSGLLGLFH